MIKFNRTKEELEAAIERARRQLQEQIRRRDMAAAAAQSLAATINRLRGELGG